MKKKSFIKKKINNIKLIENIKILDNDKFPLSNRAFYDLAYQSGAYSRYKLDPNFTDENFIKLYNTWVDNTINKSFGEKIFYTVDLNNTIISFATLSHDKLKGRIGLIAVDNSARGKGIGKSLIEFIENYLYTIDIRLLEIPTQKTNNGANKFYKKLGYTVTKSKVIRHFWKI